MFFFFLHIKSFQPQISSEMIQAFILYVEKRCLCKQNVCVNKRANYLFHVYSTNNINISFKNKTVLLISA